MVIITYRSDSAATPNFCASSKEGRVQWLVDTFGICTSGQSRYVLGIRIYRMSERKSLTSACSRTHQIRAADVGRYEVLIYGEL